jgi:hypothetical protein
MFNQILRFFGHSVLTKANPRPGVKRHLRMNDLVMHYATRRSGQVTGIEKFDNDRLVTVELSTGEMLNKLHEKEFVLAHRAG